MKIAMISGFIITLFAVVTDNDLSGRWETKPSENGNVTGVVFKTDYSFEGYINKKPFVTGTYQFQDSIFSFVDNGCEGRRGIYRINFFSNGDSLRFIPIEDSCEDRKQGMSRLIMGKVKESRK